MTHESEYLRYNSANYESFNWNPLSYSSLPMSETYGLDYESARNATPHWYAVSFGNGNDGVSHMFPNYYVRTSDPFKLAAAAVIASFKDEYKAKAAKAVEVEGEAEYTITAMILNPEDVEGYPEPNMICELCGTENPPNSDQCEQCDSDELSEAESEDDYCSANGAWLLCDVFSVDPMPGALLPNGEFAEYNPFDKSAYCSLESCFDETDLKLSNK